VTAAEVALKITPAPILIDDGCTEAMKHYELNLRPGGLNFNLGRRRCGCRYVWHTPFMYRRSSDGKYEPVNCRVVVSHEDCES